MLQKKIIQIFLFSTFLLLGMSSAIFINSNSAIASSSCSKTWCQSGSCAANYNMTACASPTGQLPCTGHLNCMPNPNPGGPEYTSN